jgi:GWxTD domain-containing protein
VINQKLEFSLEPGKYEYRIRLGNGETETYLVRKNDIVLKNYQNNKMHTSDLIFVDEINCQNPHPNSLKPNLKNTFDKLESDFAAYFEIYSGQKTGTITIDYKVQDSQSKIKNTDRLTYTLPTEKIPVCLTFKDHIEKPGEYLLTILVRGDQNIEKIKKKFGVNWTKIGIRTDNIDVAIEQLELIAKDDIIDKMKSAPEPKKNALFDEFWQKRDPSPDTPVNELKIEFFRRVDFANKNFTQVSPNRPGWKTDRGRIYIKNGPPSEVEKHPTELNMPTAEIWYYARLNKRYIFTDRHGTGDYRLIRVE